MNKLFIILAMAALGSDAKAQDLISKYLQPKQLPAIKADTSVSAFTGIPNNLAQQRNDTFTRNMVQDALKKAYFEKMTERDNYNDTIYSTMPVAANKSNSHMPVVKPGSTDTHYTMLVKRIAIVDPTKVEKEEKVEVKP